MKDSVREDKVNLFINDQLKNIYEFCDKNESGKQRMMSHIILGGMMSVLLLHFWEEIDHSKTMITWAEYKNTFIDMTVKLINKSTSTYRVRPREVLEKNIKENS